MTRKKKSAPPEQGKTPSGAQDDRAAEEFVKGLVERGEAAKAKDGELPPGATHEIVEEREGELPKVRRRRFSSF